MVTEIEMLNCIHQNADMAKDSLEHILPMSADSAFTKELEKQKAEYARAYQKSEALLRERNFEQGKDAPAVTKMMSGVMAKLKNLADPSTEELAEMVFQGNNMGISDLSKCINGYQGEDKEVLNLAKKLLAQEEKNAEAMKKFL